MLRIPHQDTLAVPFQPVGTPTLQGGGIIPVQTNPEQIGQAGAALQQAGQTLTGIALEEQSRIDVATVKSRLNALRERAQRRVTDFEALTGQDATKGYVQARQDLMDARREAESTLDDYQREMFKENADAMMFAAEEGARAHWQKQAKAFELGETSVRAQGLLEDAVKAGLTLNAPGGVSQFAKMRSQALREVELLSKLKGDGPAETAAMVQKAEASIHTTVVKSMLEGRDTAAAEQYLKTWGERMPPDVVSEIRGKIDTVMAVETGARLGAGLLSAALEAESQQYPSPSSWQDPPEPPMARFMRQEMEWRNAMRAAQAEVYRRFDAREIGLRERDAALAEIESREKLRSAALDEDGAAVIKAAQAYWAANPHMEVMDPNIVAAASGLGVLDKIEKPSYARGVAAEIEKEQQDANYGAWLNIPDEEVRAMNEATVFKRTNGGASGLSPWQREAAMKRWSNLREGKDQRGYVITAEDKARIQGLARRVVERRRFNMNSASQRGEAERLFQATEGRVTEQIVRQLDVIANPTHKDFLVALEYANSFEVEVAGKRQLAVELSEPDLMTAYVTTAPGVKVRGSSVDWTKFYGLTAAAQQRVGKLSPQETADLLREARLPVDVKARAIVDGRVPLNDAKELLGVGDYEAFVRILGRHPKMERDPRINRGRDVTISVQEVEEALRNQGR